MLLEEIYGLDTMNPLQHRAYREIMTLLRPIDEGIVDHYHSSSMVKRERGFYHLEIVMKPVWPNALRLLIDLLPEKFLISLDGITEEYVPQPPQYTEDQAIKQLTSTIRNVFMGNIKVTEERSNGRGYRWTRYDYIDGEWQRNMTRKTILRNVFGQKSTVDKFCKLYER